MCNNYVGVPSRLEWDDENLLAAKKDDLSSNKDIMFHLRNNLWAVDANFLYQS